MSNILISYFQVNFRADKKDSFMYNDKFTYSKFSPSVSHFGGKATQGWIAVTSTSLVNKT